jgi:hypothetical protein
MATAVPCDVTRNSMPAEFQDLEDELNRLGIRILEIENRPHAGMPNGVKRFFRLQCRDGSSPRLALGVFQRRFPKAGIVSHVYNECLISELTKA